MALTLTRPADLSFSCPHRRYLPYPRHCQLSALPTSLAPSILLLALVLASSFGRSMVLLFSRGPLDTDIYGPPTFGGIIYVIEAVPPYPHHVARYATAGWKSAPLFPAAYAPTTEPFVSPLVHRRMYRTELR